MDAAAVKGRIVELARQELRWQGDLPSGDLAEALDSVQRLQLVVAIEDEFKICFDPDDEDGARTLEDVVATVLRLLDTP